MLSVLSLFLLLAIVSALIFNNDKVTLLILSDSLMKGSINEYLEA